MLKQPSGISGEDNPGAEEKKEVDKLKKRDQEVKAHEQAHIAAGSGVVIGGANYEYQRGPDGKMCAVGGEVKIDTSRENSPAQTISKMQQVTRATLAPAQPSAQDRSVAAQAAQVEADARSELAKESRNSKRRRRLRPIYRPGIRVRLNRRHLPRGKYRVQPCVPRIQHQYRNLSCVKLM